MLTITIRSPHSTVTLEFPDVSALVLYLTGMGLSTLQVAMMLRDGSLKVEEVSYVVR